MTHRSVLLALDEKPIKRQITGENNSKARGGQILSQVLKNVRAAVECGINVVDGQNEGIVAHMPEDTFDIVLKIVCEEIAGIRVVQTFIQHKIGIVPVFVVNLVLADARKMGKASGQPPEFFIAFFGRCPAFVIAIGPLVPSDVFEDRSDSIDEKDEKVLLFFETGGIQESKGV